MACTTCVDSCLCSVVGTAPITVTGSGSGADPFRIAIDLCTGFAALTDLGRTLTQTDRVITLTAGGACGLANAPASESPFVGVPDGLVTITPGDNPANGTVGNGHMPTISVTCEDVQDCVGPMLDWMTGWAYNDAADRWESTGAVGQVLTVTSAGDASWAAPATQPQTAVTVSDTATINLTASGVDNHTIQADAILSAPGCGLVATGGINGLRVNTLPWTYPCADTNGTAIVCDANGNLRGAPEHTCVQSGRNGNTQQFPGFGPGQGFGAAVAATINNPSPCRSMVVNADYTIGVTILNAFASTMIAFLRVNQGISYTGLYGLYDGNPATFADASGRSTVTLMNSDVGTLGAGGSLTVSVEAGLELNGVAANVGLSATAMLWGCTQ